MSPLSKVSRRSTSVRPILRLLALLCCAAGLSGSAFASPITYTLSGLFSGTLGNQSFSNAQATFMLSGSDTSGITSSNQAFFFNTLGTATFQLGSGAAVNILSTSFGVESEYGSASFLDFASGFAAGEYNELTAYDVLRQYGSTTGSFVSYGTESERTSGGALVLTGGGDLTFTGAAPAIAVTPEPGSLMLTATGLLGLAGVLRRRIRSNSVAA